MSNNNICSRLSQQEQDGQQYSENSDQLDIQM